MDFEELKNSVNEWLWDGELGTYFWILEVDSGSKIIKARGLSGRHTALVFSKDRFFKNIKTVRRW